MNKRPYPKGPHVAIWSRAVDEEDCITCGCSAGFYCEIPAGRKTAGAKRWPPHDDRVKKLLAKNPTAGQLKVEKFEDILNRLGVTKK